MCPVTFIMPNGSSIVVESDNEEGWEELKSWYDENPDSEEWPDFQYPVDIILEEGITTTVNNESEMDGAKSSCVDCFQLVYPVTFIMPDRSSIVIESDSWEELISWYDENPNSYEEWPSFQYPVDIILEDGTTTTINSDQEMDSIKLSCE